MTEDISNYAALPATPDSSRKLIVTDEVVSAVDAFRDKKRAENIRKQHEAINVDPLDLTDEDAVAARKKALRKLAAWGDKPRKTINDWLELAIGRPLRLKADEVREIDATIKSIDESVKAAKHDEFFGARSEFCFVLECSVQDRNDIGEYLNKHGYHVLDVFDRAAQKRAKAGGASDAVAISNMTI